MKTQTKIRLRGFAAIATVALAACGSTRQQNYDSAMRGAVSGLRSGNLTSASSSLRTAAANADGQSQREAVGQLSLLVSGAEAYDRGDRDQAGRTWSGAQAPEIRRALMDNQGALGVSISALPTN